jgi:Spy/CpxP family protein refolding chaperone
MEEQIPHCKEAAMLNQLLNSGTVRVALAAVFALVIVAGTLAVAVPAGSQTAAQEEAAIRAEQAQGRVDGAEPAEPPEIGRPGFGELAQRRRPGLAGGPMGRRGRGGTGGGRFDLASRALGRAEEIGLTDEQSQQIEAARDAHRRQQIERDAAMKLVGLDLMELLRDDSSDPSVVEQKMREAADLKVQEQMAALTYRRDVQGILTAEQIEQLKELGADFMRRRMSEHRAPRTRRQR